MIWLRSALFTLLFYPFTVLAVLMAFAGAPFGQAPVISAAVFWTRGHAWLARNLLGIRTRVEGTLPTRPVLIAAKHQSMYETLEFVRLLDRPAVVMKKELTDTPGWGKIAKLYGAVSVDRKAGAAALREMMRDGRAAIAQGRGIVIFPEGTRVAPGERPPLQPGFAGLYRAIGLPVVPVAIDSGRLWGRNSFLKHPGTITFRFGQEIPAGLPRAEVEQRVHTGMNALDTPL